MKEIRMPYSEYEEMIKLIAEKEDVIKELQDVIAEFKKDSKVILINERIVHPLWAYYVPIIITNNELMAKEYLKNEFEIIRNKYVKGVEYVLKIKKQLYSKEKEVIDLKEKKKSWWSF